MCRIGGYEPRGPEHHVRDPMAPFHKRRPRHLSRGGCPKDPCPPLKRVGARLILDEVPAHEWVGDDYRSQPKVGGIKKVRALRGRRVSAYKRNHWANLLSLAMACLEHSLSQSCGSCAQFGELLSSRADDIGSLSR